MFLVCNAWGDFDYLFVSSQLSWWNEALPQILAVPLPTLKVLPRIWTRDSRSEQRNIGAYIPCSVSETYDTYQFAPNIWTSLVWLLWSCVVFQTEITACSTLNVSDLMLSSSSGEKNFSITPASALAMSDISPNTVVVEVTTLRLE